MTTSLNDLTRVNSAAEAIALLRDPDLDLEHPVHSEVFYAVAEHTLIDLADAATHCGGKATIQFIDSGIEVERGGARRLLIQLRESYTELNHCTVDLTVTDTTSQPFIPVNELRRKHDPFSTCTVENISVAQTHVLLRHFLLGDRFHFSSNGRTVSLGWARESETSQQASYSLPAAFLEAGLLERFILEDHDFSR